MSKGLQSTTRLVTAAAIYVAFAAYLYQPYRQNFHRWEYLFLVNSPMAAVGCYVLSRRWVPSFAGSFFAGAIYGFGSFMLGLDKFHPTAGFLAATVPWLFCPAAFSTGQKWRQLSIPLSLLPYLAIALFFQVSLYYRLFAVPAQAKLHLADLVGLVAPLVAARQGLMPVGFYHIPLAPLIMGFSMLIQRLKVGRMGIIIILVTSVVLAFCKPFLNVSPIIWLAIPVVCCSVLIGAGTQGLISAGFADRKWVLATAGICGALAIVTLLLATKYFQTFLALGAGYAKVFADAGRIYSLGAITMLVIFFLVRAKLPAERRLPIRPVLLCLAMAADIFLGARFIVDVLL
jgi:hypothetical protein